MAQLELMNAVNSIKSEAELNEFKTLVAHFFAQKAQKNNCVFDKKSLSLLSPSASLQNGADCGMIRQKE
jgi:hypothetical protein